MKAPTKACHRRGPPATKLASGRGFAQPGNVERNFVQKVTKSKSFSFAENLLVPNNFRQKHKKATTIDSSRFQSVFRKRSHFDLSSNTSKGIIV